MDTDFGPTQRMLGRTARDFLKQECPSSLVRQLFDSETGHSRELWRKMVDLGWPGLILPEEYGGGGCALIDLAVLCEELGRALGPSTFYSTVVGALAILNGGTPEQKHRFLPRVCSGGILLTLALTEPAGSYDPATLSSRAIQEGDHWVIKGTKLFVQDAQSADYFVVVARTSEGQAGEGVGAFIVPARSSGISVSSLVSFGGEHQAEVVFDSVKVAQTDVLGEPGQAWAAMEKTLQQQIALQLADTIGVGRQALEMTVEYVKLRIQFGVPIGSFQAVQHFCANMAIDLDGARLLSYEAIWKLSEGLSAAKELSMAKAAAPEAVKRITLLSHQLHGGIGFATEHDLHLYSARAKAAEQILGTPIEHLELVAQHLGL